MPPTALFIIDIQNNLATDSSTQIPHASRILSAGTQIIAAARQVVSDAKAAGSETPLSLYFIQHEEPATSGPLVRGSEPWKLVFEPIPERGEELIAKSTRDVFPSNPLLSTSLKYAGTKTIIAFGIQSECCVLSTCLGALSAGFQVILLQGAHSTYETAAQSAEEIEADVEAQLLAKGAKVVRWEDMLEIWRTDGAEKEGA